MKTMKILVLVLLWVLISTEAQAQRQPRNARTARSAVGQEYHQENYLVQFGYQRWYAEAAKGYLFTAHGEYLYYPAVNRSGWSFGPAVDLAGGDALWQTDVFYREPQLLWTAGAKVRYRTSRYYYELVVGYGQVYRDARISSELTDRIFSDFMEAQAVCRLYALRSQDKLWFSDVAAKASIRFPLFKDETKEESFLPPEFIGKNFNPQLAPQFASLTLEAAVFDWHLGKDYLLAFGLEGSACQYDNGKPKFFYEAGTFISSYYNKKEIGRVGIKLQNGISPSNDNIVRWNIYIQTNLDILFSEQEQANQSTTNTRRRVR